MTLDEIHQSWSEDSTIDEVELDKAAGETPRLHSKYLRFMSNERMVMKKLEADLIELVQAKGDRLTGQMSPEELSRRGWTPELKRYSQVQVGPVVESDPEVVNLKLRISLQKEKVEVLDSIVKMIMGRNYVVSNIISWKKFLAGAN